MSQAEKNGVPTEIVHAARALGHWINLAAYRAAKEEVEKDKKAIAVQTDKKIQQHKAKILVALDSMAMGARTPAALTSSIMRETGMLANAATTGEKLMFGDAPQEALPFLDATIDGTISLETARQLLMTYMRVRFKTEKPIGATGVAPDAGNDESTEYAPTVADEGE